MQVGDAFAAVATVVDHEPVAGLGDAEFFCERSGGEEEVAKGGLVGSRGFADARDELLRDDEYVHRCLRMDVVNGDTEIVLVRELGGNLAVDNFLEESL